MIDTIIQYVPLPIFFAVFIAGIVAVWRFFGLRVALAVGVIAIIIFANISGHKDGWKQREDKGRADAVKALRKANNARADSDRVNAQPDRLRGQDGFRRD